MNFRLKMSRKYLYMFIYIYIYIKHLINRNVYSIYLDLCVIYDTTALLVPKNHESGLLGVISLFHFHVFECINFYILMF
jgi:hypothetical protein